MSVEALISLAFCTFHWKEDITNTRKVISSKKNCTFDFVFWRYCSLSDYLNVNGLSLTNARKEWNRRTKQRELIAEKQKLWRTYIGLKWSDLCASDRNLKRVVSFSLYMNGHTYLSVYSKSSFSQICLVKMGEHCNSFSCFSFHLWF